MSVLCFGELLWDIIDGKEYIGGAPYNVAAHNKKLGVASYMYTRVGNDDLGIKALAEVKRHKVNAEFVQIDSIHQTGTACVQLDDNAVPTFTLTKNTAYDFIEASPELCSAISEKNFDLFYFGTVSQKGAVSEASLHYILENCSFKEVFCDINIRKPFYTKEIIEYSLSKATILKINDGELILISKMFFGDMNEEEAISALFNSYNNIHTVLITKGPDGCTVYSKKSGSVLSKSLNYCVSPAVDTVGAGDAFSAGFIYSYLNGDDIFEASRIGNIMGDYVASQKGAIPEYDAKLLIQ